jgi:hypothetical protein
LSSPPPPFVPMPPPRPKEGPAPALKALPIVARRRSAALAARSQEPRPGAVARCAVRALRSSSCMMRASLAVMMSWARRLVSRNRLVGVGSQGQSRDEQEKAQW